MHSVDSAAVSFFSQYDCDFDLLCAQLPAGRKGAIAGRNISLLENRSQLDDYSHIVFWGDFLNNPVYGAQDFSKKDTRLGFSASLDAGYERWQDLFTFRDNPAQARVVSVGNNFQHDFTRRRNKFVPPLQRMAQEFTAFLPRDPFSTRNLSRFFEFGTLNKIRQGMDCAFLLDGRKGETENTFSYFFGRSGFQGIDTLISQIEAATGLKPTHVENWFRLQPHNADSEFEKMRQKIAKSRFVITDTYHFAINSFVLGVPVIGMGRTQTMQRGTGGDFKKRTLFEMLGQSDRYFEALDEDDAAFFSRVVEHCFETDLILRDNPSRLFLIDELRQKYRRDVAEAVFG
ncbi:polysaccharide pyruvyl transferase family protein [Ruegeria sp. MALMAid1280]|uniref:polysaccharide pyruvyl transferase family protein n=1 Tax=Ruegeria sp. MALMAid1280 TaxID=3411634 RepID=UPI003B9E83CC